jgi:hypothetical protein
MLEPILSKYTTRNVQSGFKDLEKAGSLDAEKEYNQWVENNVDDPAPHLAAMDSDKVIGYIVEDSEPESANDSEGIEVVITSDEESEMEDDDDSDSSSIDNFIAQDEDSSEAEDTEDMEDSSNREALEVED